MFSLLFLFLCFALCCFCFVFLVLFLVLYLCCVPLTSLSVSSCRSFFFCLFYCALFSLPLARVSVVSALFFLCLAHHLWSGLDRRPPKAPSGTHQPPLRVLSCRALCSAITFAMQLAVLGGCLAVAVLGTAVCHEGVQPVSRRLCNAAYALFALAYNLWFVGGFLLLDIVWPLADEVLLHSQMRVPNPIPAVLCFQHPDADRQARGCGGRRRGSSTRPHR